MFRLAFIVQRSVLIFMLAAVAACTTNVSDLRPLPDKSYKIIEISVEGNLRSNATAAHIGVLETAVRKEIALRNSGSFDVDLKISITRAEFVSQGTRALAGALAGSNHLDLRVHLLEPGTSNSVGEFEVRVDNNPGGWGMFSNPVASACNDAAKAIVQKIFKS